MPHIRNGAVYDLEVAGRVYPAGAVVEVSEVEAGYLVTNPNFTAVPEPKSKASGDAATGKKA